MYGDPKSYDLRNALAAFHNLEPLNMVVGEGIDGLLAYTCQLLVGPGDAVVTTHGTYPTLNYFVAGRGGKLVEREEKKYEMRFHLYMAREI